jgi:DnaJ-class molecular chaperone
MRDPYLVLGVKRTASMDEIKAAWRLLAKSVHPDRNQNDPQANARFTEAGQAYQLLKDPEKRYRFDTERRMAEDARKRDAGTGGNPGKAKPGKAESKPGASFSDFFAKSERPAASPFAGPAGETAAGGQDSGGSDILSSVWRKMAGKPNAPGQAPDLALDVTVTIEDIMNRTRPLVTLPDGKTLRITLPEDASDGKQVRIAGQGHKIAGMKRGDLMVTFRLARHPVFRPDGLDLYTSVPVDIENAVLGCETIVDAPDGPVRIKVPEWTSSDHVVRIKGRGLPGKDGERGDLLAEIRVMLWDHPDDKVKDLMRSLREGLFL